MTDVPSVEAQLAELRSTLEAAKDACGTDRENYLKAALAETLELQARNELSTDELHRLVAEAVVAPAHAVTPLVNRALAALEDIEKSIRGDVPDGTAGTREAATPLSDDPFTIGEQLAELGVEAEVSVDIPEEFARLVEGWADARGFDPGHSDVEMFLVNHLAWSYEFTVEGDPWESISCTS